VKCQLGTGQKFRATFCSQIQTVFLASSRRPPEIKSRDFLSFRLSLRFATKIQISNGSQQIAGLLILLPLCAKIYGRSPKSIRSSSPISDFFPQQMIASQDFFRQNLTRVHSIAEKKNHNNKKEIKKFVF
jgi:hypothetical protein